ncbi:hypothetical protein KKC59_02680, partial [bacterium]|nr:hypothetical protein [bacterium]
NKIKEYYLELSNIVKKYMERRYNILAVEYTTSEIAAALKKLKIGMDNYGFIYEFLGEADLVKFAKLRPDKAECLKSADTAREIVERTKRTRDEGRRTMSEVRRTKDEGRKI